MDADLVHSTDYSQNKRLLYTTLVSKNSNDEVSGLITPQKSFVTNVLLQI